MEENEIKQNEAEEKPKKQKKEKSVFSKLINAILWIVVFAWMAVCVTDYVMAINEKDPIFCLKEETKEYEDGTVYICTGLGYKYFKYDRTSYSATQFGGIWVKEHDPYAEK